MVDEAIVAAAAAAVDAGEVLEYARSLIAAKSENPGGSEDEAAGVASEILTDAGSVPEVVRSPAGRPSVVATIGDGDGPSLAWNGHLDVVPAGSPDTWSHDPWAGEVDAGGRLVGRGAADMKGPIAAALRRSGTPIRGSLVFHLAADEELAGVHGTKVLWERDLLTQDAAIVGEPSELQI
ncbi:MAG TPA: M20/M25/M40 family metallo-hydrolase, partial [Actinomycetota bacterium]|nr:M20/M25/M40 family metallo-hydrolase [Actinomycetota bacterium]